MDELLSFGPKQLPLVSKGRAWVNGQSLKDVARLAGINLGKIQHLPPPELVRRIDLIVDACGRYFAQYPDERLGDLLPGRPRSYAQLAWHLFNVVDAFLEHEQGIPLINGAYDRNVAPGTSKDGILAYGVDVRRRFAEWWRTHGDTTDWTAKAQVYYGDVARHEFLERTTWHSGQHSRQLEWILRDTLGIQPDSPLGPETWVGLPMPEKVWDS